MSTSKDGSDATSQEVANKRIEELERQLFVLREEKQRDMLGIEAATKKLRDTFREDTASKDPTGSPESPLGIAELQAENEKQQAEIQKQQAEIEHLKKLVTQEGSMWNHVLKLRERVEWDLVRMRRDAARAKQLREYTTTLKDHATALRTKFEETRELQAAGKEQLKPSAERASSSIEKLGQVQRNYVEKVTAEFEAFSQFTQQAQKRLASAKKVTELGWADVRKATDEANYALTLRRTKVLTMFDIIVGVTDEALQIPLPQSPPPLIEITTPAPEVSSKKTVEVSATPKSANADQISSQKVKVSPSAKTSKDSHNKNRITKNPSSSRTSKDDDNNQNPDKISATLEEAKEVLKGKETGGSSSPKQTYSKGGHKVNDVKAETPSMPMISHHDETKKKQDEIPFNPRIYLDKETKGKQRETTISPGQPEYDQNEDRGAGGPPFSMQESPNVREDWKEQSVEKEGYEAVKGEKAKEVLPAKHEVSEVEQPLKAQHEMVQTLHRADYSMPDLLQLKKEEDVRMSNTSCSNSQSYSGSQTALLKQQEHQMSEYVLLSQSEIEEAGLRYHNLKGQFEGLEQKYQELERIHATVADENAVLNRKIQRTLEAFIPTAEKMLHQGTKINKKAQDLLNALVKIVRDGLRDS